MSATGFPAPASYDSVSAVGYKLADTRSDLLVGQGQILKNAGDNVSAILRDANNNAQFANANIERNGVAGIQETVRQGERVGAQANTIAWNEMSLQDAGFAAQRAQNERINEAQSAMSDRAAKYNAQMTSDSFGRLAAQTSDSFARLSAQGENGFARELDATTQGTRQVVQSEMGVTRSLGDGFRDGSAALAANYANLSAQNFGTRETVAAYGNRTADQTASVLHSLTGQHTAATRDLIGVSKEIAVQAALNAAANQLETSKQGAASQLQGALNTKDIAMQAAANAKDISLQAAVNSKEAVLQASFLAKDALLENSKWFALAEKTAMINKCELEAKMAACCCEIKEAVIVTSNATQSLVQTNESARVRDALSAAVAENSILRLRREERGYPVPYPFPFPRSVSPRRGGDSPRR
jgi:hypothetical protein